MIIETTVLNGLPITIEAWYEPAEPWNGIFSDRTDFQILIPKNHRWLEKRMTASDYDHIDAVIRSNVVK